MEVEINTLVLAVIAVINLITAVLTVRTHIAAVATQANVEIIEKATNSMKDALVATTGKAAFLAGRQEATIEGEVKAAAIAEGKLQGQP